MMLIIIFYCFSYCVDGHRYIITTYTGNVIDAGTNSNIFINVIGKEKESGKVALTAVDKDIFERNEIDTFLVQCDYLGELTKIHVFTDLFNPGSRWFLDKITISSENGDYYEFPSYSWVDKNKTNELIEKEFKSQFEKRSTLNKIDDVIIFEPLDCNQELGVKNGEIQDYQITASTSFNDLHLPFHARLDHTVPNSFGGWCPYNENYEEYLQIDFEKLTNITGIATQGLSLVDEWTVSYYIKYKSPKDYSWTWYTSNNQIKEFHANHDQNSTIQHWISPSIISKVVRIYPREFHGKSCLRVEFFGCGLLNGTSDTHDSNFTQHDKSINVEVTDSPIGVESASRRSENKENIEFHGLQPILYINFNNISSEGVVKDYSGSKNDVKIHPPVDIIPFSRSCGPGVRLDGGSLIIDGEFFIDKPITAISILTWIKLFSNGGQHPIFNTWYNHDNVADPKIGYNLLVEKGRVKWSHSLKNLGYIFNISSGLQVPAHVWTHVAVTYDSMNGKTAILINGKLAAQSITVENNFTLSQDWSDGAFIGTLKQKKSLNGELDEFYIFRNALSPSKIENIMKNCFFEIDCKNAIGLESRVIPDTHMTATSHYNLHYAYYGRLNLVGINGDPARTAWCADGKDASPYMEIDLEELKTITGVSIQGLGLFDNWITGFNICYNTNNEGNIFCVKENGIDKIFEGNNDKNSVVHHNLKYSIASNKIRIRPVSWFGNHLCMRLELFGCSMDLFPDPFDNGGASDNSLFDTEAVSRQHIPDSCDHPLGISSGELDDLHFSSSSELDEEHQSRFARLILDGHQNEENGPIFTNISKKSRNTWCTNDVNLRQYIEIDLGEIKNITGIATQGYFNKENWVTSYRIGYSDDLGPIKWYTEDGVDKIFEANTDSKHIIKNYFMKSIKAQYIRINPRAWVGPHICMRLEVYGCNLENLKESYINSNDKETITKNIKKIEEDSQASNRQTLIPILINPKTITENIKNVLPESDDVSENKTDTINQSDTPNIITTTPPNIWRTSPTAYITQSSTHNSDNLPSKWSRLISSYPELVKHGVSENLLVSVSRIIPNLEERIVKYFQNPYKPLIYPIPEPNLNTDIKFLQSDLRKGMIEHFINSYDSLPQESNVSFDPWYDPNSNEWSQFTGCSQSCGMGVRMRHRNCDYPVCSNPTMETEVEPCHIAACENYITQQSSSSWSPYTACSKTCGDGKSMRVRICDGIICPIPGYETQTISCYNLPCPVCYLDFEDVEDRRIVVDKSGTGNNVLMDGGAFIQMHEENICGFYIDLNKTGRLILPDQTFRNKPKFGISIALWIRVKIINGVSSIFATEISDGKDQFMGSYHFEIFDGKIRWFHRNERSEIIFSFETSEVIIYQDVWMHVCVTYDTKTMTGYLFVDGNERSSFYGYNPLPLTVDWGARAIIGDYDFDIRHLNGQIDDFYIFDYSISNAQIQTLLEKKQTCHGK